MAWRILLLGSLLLGGTAFYQNICSYLPALAAACPQKPAQKEQLILVAGFEGDSEAESKRITDAVVESVKQAMGEMSDARIKVLNRTITAQQGSEAAREEGKKQNADVVIWGGQPKTGGNAPINVNFEVLGEGKEAKKATPQAPETKATPQAPGVIAATSTAEPKSFKLQRQLLFDRAIHDILQSNASVCEGRAAFGTNERNSLYLHTAICRIL
ncbi:hypothetical protein [Oscillatoria sp. FACHB-1406]|uniref:hypothetical protein n=1 Tax=Oscillatoria sp. FACHB-1406 TaxID=2692846 RepID=UPI0016838156|nr:hypothetical protein [Oscillatoria sp. FACHB-1406]MBD2580633.1 hypothetical protein [Oscillatoria sp. FACHB-1406]